MNAFGRFYKMAKISIHIPDDILERVKVHKDRLNISKICSTALLKEVEVIANLPPLIEETRKLIDRLRKDTQKQHIESFDLGIKMAQGYMSKVSFEQLRFWGTMTQIEMKRLVLPEKIEDKLEKYSLDNKFTHPLHRPSFARGWLSIMKRTWETVKDKV